MVAAKCEEPNRAAWAVGGIATSWPSGRNGGMLRVVVPGGQRSRKAAFRAQPLVSTPSRFSSTLATTVHAASSAASIPAAAGRADRSPASPRPSRPSGSGPARLEQRHDVPHLLAVGGGRHRQSRSPKRRPLLGRRAALLDDPPGQGLGRLDVDRIVQRHERLQRRVRADAADGADLAARGVERRHRRVRDRPPPEGVQAAAVAVLARAGRPGPLAVEGRLPQARRLRRVDATARRSSRLSRPLSASAWSRTISASSRNRGAARQQPVARVLRQQLRRHLRRLAVGRRGDDQSSAAPSSPSRRRGRTPTASQSSSSGWLGSSPCVPKSSSVSTSPMPKSCAQKRLTATRAVSGLSGRHSQRATPSRSVAASCGQRVERGRARRARPRRPGRGSCP